MTSFRGKADVRVWKDLIARVRPLDKFALKVGIVSDRPHEGSDLTIAELGAVHEYGAPAAGIEARPWLSFTMQDRRKDIAAMFERASKAILSGKSTALAELSRMGTFMSTAVKRSIVQKLIRQELAASTIKRRESKGTGTAALLETHQLYDAIGFKIDKR